MTSWRPVLSVCVFETWSVCPRCRGAVTRCIKSTLGCAFQGPRSALQSHLWECAFRDQASGKCLLYRQWFLVLILNFSCLSVGVFLLRYMKDFGNNTVLNITITQKLCSKLNCFEHLWPAVAVYLSICMIIYTLSVFVIQITLRFWCCWCQFCCWFCCCCCFFNKELQL